MATRLKTKDDVLAYHDVVGSTTQFHDAMDTWSKVQVKAYVAWCAKKQKDPFDVFGNWESFTDDTEETGH